jgi:carbon monoxide dehydrogenase subunit G
MLTLQGTQLIRTSLPTAWALLTTPTAVLPLVPQVQGWQATAVDNQFSADLVVPWGGKTIRFPSQINWYNEVATWQAALHLSGQSSQSAFTAYTQMQLRPGFGQQAELVWQAELQLGGQLAEIPLSVVRLAAWFHINQFFQAVRQALPPTVL